MDDERDARRAWEYNPGPNSLQMSRMRYLRRKRRRRVVLDLCILLFFVGLLWSIFHAGMFDFLRRG